MDGKNEQFYDPDVKSGVPEEETPRSEDDLEAPLAFVSIAAELKRGAENVGFHAQKEISEDAVEKSASIDGSPAGKQAKHDIDSAAEQYLRRIEEAQRQAENDLGNIAEKMVKAVMGENAFDFDDEDDRARFAHQEMLRIRREYGKDSPEGKQAYEDWKYLYDKGAAGEKQAPKKIADPRDGHPIRRSIKSNMGVEEGRKKFKEIRELIENAQKRKKAKNIKEQSAFVNSPVAADQAVYREEIGGESAATTEELADMRGLVPEQAKHSSRYLANYEKLKAREPELSDKQIDERIKGAETGVLRRNEKLDNDIDSLLDCLCEDKMTGFELNDVLARIEKQTGMPIDDIAAIFDNQKKDLEIKSDELARAQKSKLKTISTASLKALGYGAVGAGVVVASGGAGLLAGLSAAGIAGVKLLDRLRVGIKENREGLEELKKIKSRLHDDAGFRDDYKNRIYAEISSRIQAEIDGQAEDIKYIDQEIELAEKEYIGSLAGFDVENDTPKHREEMKEWLYSLKQRKFDLSRKILGEYLNNNPDYNRTNHENIVRQANGISEIDSNNQLMEATAGAKVENEVDRYVGKGIGARWFKGLGKKAMRLLGVDTQRDRRESVAEKTAKSSVFIMAGLMAKEVPVLRNILMAYGGAKGADALAKWRTGDTKERYKILRQLKYADLAAKDSSMTGESLDLARTQILDPEFKKSDPSEYALIKNELDRLEQEMIRDRADEALDYVSERTKGIVGKMAEKAATKERQRRLRAAAKIGGAVLGAVAPEVMAAAIDHLNGKNAEMRVDGSSQSGRVEEEDISPQEEIDGKESIKDNNKEKPDDAGAFTDEDRERNGAKIVSGALSGSEADHNDQHDSILENDETGDKTREMREGSAGVDEVKKRTIYARETKPGELAEAVDEVNKRTVLGSEEGSGADIKDVDELEKRTVLDETAGTATFESMTLAERKEAFLAEHAILGKTGAEVNLENGRIKVSYEIGKDGDFQYLDQALRRVVVDNIELSTEKFSALEAARVENALANLRELIQGRDLAGLKAEEIKELVSFDQKTGALRVDDYDKLSEKIGSLVRRAELTVNEHSDAMAEVNNTANYKWQEMVDQKIGSEGGVIVDDFNDNDKVFEAEERVRARLKETKASIKGSLTELGSTLGADTSSSPESSEVPAGSQSVASREALLSIAENEGKKVYYIKKPELPAGRDPEGLKEGFGQIRGGVLDPDSGKPFFPENLEDEETGAEYRTDHRGRAISLEDWQRHYQDYPRLLRLENTRAHFDVNAVPEHIDIDKMEVIDKLPDVRNRELVELEDGRLGIRDTVNGFIYIKTENNKVYTAYENSHAVEFFSNKHLGDLSKAAEKALDEKFGKGSAFLPRDESLAEKNSAMLPE